MAQLMINGAKCEGSNCKAAGLRTIEKKRRNDTPGSMILSWCSFCRQWVGVTTNGKIRTHRKSR